MDAPAAAAPPPPWAALDLRVLSTIGGYADTADLVALMGTCQALYQPELLEDRLAAAAPPHVPRPALSAAARAFRWGDAPVAVRARRTGELLRALGDARLRSAGVPSSRMAISWRDTPSYWQAGAPEASSPYGAVDVLRNVCWLDISGVERLAPGDYAALLRIKATRYFGAALRCELTPATGADATGGEFVTLTQPSDATTGRGGPGMRTSELPTGPWLWLYVGRATVSAKPVAGGAAGAASSSAAGDAAAASSPGAAAAAAAAAFPPDGAGVRFHVWDHGGDWKSGLHVDHLAWVPWGSLPALLEGAAEAAGAGGVSVGGSSAAATAPRPGSAGGQRAGAGADAAAGSTLPAIPWSHLDGLDISGADGAASSSAVSAEHPAVASLLARGWAMQPPSAYWSRLHPGVTLGGRDRRRSRSREAPARDGGGGSGAGIMTDDEGGGASGAAAAADAAAPAGGVQPHHWVRFPWRMGRHRGDGRGPGGPGGDGSGGAGAGGGGGGAQPTS